MNVKPEGLTEGEPHKWGVPFSHKVLDDFIIRFFLWHHRRKEKSLAKKKRQRRVSPSADGDQRYARWIGGRFLKKATQKLLSKLTAKSQFIEMTWERQKRSERRAQLAVNWNSIYAARKYSSQSKQLRSEGGNRIFPKQSADRNTALFLLDKIFLRLYNKNRIY